MLDWQMVGCSSAGKRVRLWSDRDQELLSAHHFGCLSTSLKIEELMCQIGIKVHQALYKKKVFVALKESPVCKLNSAKLEERSWWEILLVSPLAQRA